MPGNQGLSSAFPTNLSLSPHPTDDHRCLLKEAGVGKQALVNEHLLTKPVGPGARAARIGHVELKASRRLSCCHSAAPRRLILAVALLSGGHADRSQDQQDAVKLTSGSRKRKKASCLATRDSVQLFPPTFPWPFTPPMITDACCQKKWAWLIHGGERAYEA